ncbi:MAG: HIT family protein [Betaproteobacteria bacterium]|nr:HIT family protein [Betaproteobacteria bacterium]
MTSGCVFCRIEGGQRLWRDDRCRVVLADEPFAGFCRVIWNAHVAEMTDLPPAERAHLMQVVFAVEAALRARLAPAKINLASLGNLVPHLHWHVVPRFADDSHFPQPVWGPAQRAGTARPLPDDLTAALRGDLAAVLGPAAAG